MQRGKLCYLNSSWKKRIAITIFRLSMNIVNKTMMLATRVSRFKMAHGCRARHEASVRRLGAERTTSVIKHFTASSHVKAECTFDKTGNLPGSLFTRAMHNLLVLQIYIKLFDFISDRV